MIRKAMNWLVRKGFSTKADYAEKMMQPGEKESEKDFMGRCMKEMTATERPHDQCVAICISKWSNAKG
jgi:hypothetical protein